MLRTLFSTQQLELITPLPYESKAAISEHAEDIFLSSTLHPSPEFLHVLLLQTETEEFTSRGTYPPHEL